MIGGTPVDYTISAIYETNSVYDGGAILAPMGDELMNVLLLTAMKRYLQMHSLHSMCL